MKKIHRVPAGYYDLLVAILPKELHKDLDYYLRFASIYTHRLINDKRYREEEGEDYGLVHMDKETLDDNLTKGYKKYVKVLVGAGIFSTDGSYSSTGGKAIHYKYQGDIFPLQVITIKSKAWVNKLVAIDERRAAEIRAKWNGEAIDYIYACAAQMEMNEEKSQEVVERMGRNPIVKASKKRKKAWTDEQRQQSRSRAYFEMRKAVIERDIYRTVCNNGRIYNNWCNLPRPLRETCQLAGERCYSVDIANSQVLIMCAVMLEEWKDRCSNVDIDIPMPPDLADFISFCEQGRIYKTLMEAFEYPGTKDEFKPEWFRDIQFSSVGYMMTTKMFDGFQTYFPSVADFLIRFKQDDYKRLANKMQAMEAALMIHNPDSVVMQCKAKGILILTIHDAIVCREQDAKDVRKIMKAVFAKAGMQTEPVVSEW